jgi:hypothetical protein
VGEKHPDAEVGGGVVRAARPDRPRAPCTCPVPAAGGGSDHGEHRVQAICAAAMAAAVRRRLPASSDESDGDGRGENGDATISHSGGACPPPNVCPVAAIVVAIAAASCRAGREHGGCRSLWAPHEPTGAERCAREG